MNESTPLVPTSNGDSGFSPSTQPRRDVTLGFLLGVAFLGALLGAFFLGMTYESTQSITSTSTTSQAPPSDPAMHVSDTSPYSNDDDFVRLEDDDYFVGGSSTPKYVATQFISFTINTIGGLADHGECEGQTVDPTNGVCYLGNSKNITEDVHHRLEIVDRVLARIKNDAFAESPDIDHADDILKIVMLPEFFWRGPNGAYSTEQMLDKDEGVLLQVADALRKIIADDFYNDFLFVFGTVIAARSHDDPRKPWQHALSASQVEYFNFATVMKGGPDHPHYYVVTKRYISGADFLSRATLPNPSQENKHDYAEIDDDLEAIFVSRNTTLIRDNVIELDGLRIGVEICLDHRVGTLWNTLRTKHHGELVDILLITSAGMAIERGPNPVVPGGVVYLSDGEASSAACIRSDDLDQFYPNQVCRGNVGGLKHIPVGGAGYSEFFGLTACWDLEDIDLLKGYYSMYQTQGCAYTLSTYDIHVQDDYTYYPPSVEIYPTVDLPKSAYT